MKTNFMKHKKTLIVSAILISFLLGTIIAQAATPSFTTYLMGGSLTETTSFVIWKDGSSYYTKNGATGAIEDSTNGSLILLNSLTSMGTAGGSIHIKSAMSLDTTITVDAPVLFNGQGKENSTLTWIGTGANSMFLLKNGTSRGFELRSLNLHGTDTTGSYAIEPAGIVANIKFYDVRFSNWDIGLINFLDAGRRILDANFFGCTFADNTVGMHLQDFMTEFYGGVFHYNTLALNLSTYSSFHCFGTVFSWNTLDIKTCGSVRAIGVHGGWFENSDRIIDAVSLGGTTLETINFIDCHIHSYNVTHLVDMTGITGTINFFGCRLDTSSASTIYVPAPSVQHVSFVNTINIQTQRMWGVQTGVATILNATDIVVVEHYLDGQPSVAFTGSYGTMLGEVLVNTMNSTHLTIYCENAPTSGDTTVFWSVQYP